MAKPRIFVSSTYYDLKHIRNSLEGFISDLGYDAVLFENGDIVFHHDKPLDQSCYSEIKNCHILVLIIGGRYGSPSSVNQSQDEQNVEKSIEIFNSVTKKEYETARDRDIPIYIFVEKGVLSEYQTYKRNRGNKNIEYAHVDNVNIFILVDEIYNQRRNNLIKEFDSFLDISSWLKDQWAGLFADLLSDRKSENEISSLASQIQDLRNVSSALREYSESMMRKLDPENFEQLISIQNQRITDARFERFEQEPMIEYLMRDKPKGVGIKTLFKAFQESRDIEDFLIKAQFEKHRIAEFLNEHRAPAERDYEKLKKIF